MNDKYNVICLSNQLWLDDFWTNKSHVMSRLSKLGHKVLFVEPPINLGNIFLRQILKGSWSIQRLLTWRKVEKASGVNIFSPLILIPTVITYKYHVWIIRKLCNKYFDPSRKTLLWVYNVQLKYLDLYLTHLKYDILIYDCVDNYHGFPENTSPLSTTVSRDALVTQEEALTKKANIVFATAPGLVDRLKAINPNTHFTPNVGDYEKFKDAKKIQDIPKDILPIKKPIVGFTGALVDYKFDKELFVNLAKSYPDTSFVLIGSNAIKGTEASKKDLGLDMLPNVYLLGPRPYAIIHKYFAYFDAFIIPYRLNDYTVGGCFPVKFHDALAAGLPVIVTKLPAYAPFDDVCYISNTPDAFIENVGKAIKEDSEVKRNERVMVAKENSWDGKVYKLLELISKI